MRQITVLTVLLFLAMQCRAQYNDSVHYYGGIAATGTINNTNNGSSYILNNTLKLGIRKDNYALNSSNTWVYGSQQNKLTNNDFNSTLDFNLYTVHKTLPHFYYWGLANYVSSYSLKVNNQYQAGLGAAYNIIDRKGAKLNISDGILYEKSDIFLKDTIRDIYSTFRNSLRLSFRFTIWERLSVSSTSFLQNSLSSKTDYIVKSNIAADLKIQKWLSFTAAFTYNRFNRTQKETTLFTYGLTIDKYF